MLVECGRRGKKGKPSRKGDSAAEDKAGDQPKLGYKEKKKLAKEVSHELCAYTSAQLLFMSRQQCAKLCPQPAISL